MTSEEEAAKKQVKILEKEMEYIKKEMFEAQSIVDGFEGLCRIV